MKLLFAIVTFIITMSVFAQTKVDTLIFQPHDTEFDCSGKKCKYFVDKKPATKTQYENAQTQSHNIGNCKPCWLKYIDTSEELVYEGDFYTDCCIGIYIERYSDGKLKVKGQFKKPITLIPNYSSGDCRKHGNWIYYKSNGEIEKKEEYKDGVLIK